MSDEPNKIVIICNHRTHATQLARENMIPEQLLVIITPDKTDRMYGYTDMKYYAIRPLYAREMSYVKSHRWMRVDKQGLIDAAAKIQERLA